MFGNVEKYLTEIEMEVDAGVPQAESHDYLCEALSISPEEAEELAFVPSAINEP